MVSLISLYPLASSRRFCDGGRVELRLTLVFLSLLLSQTQKLAFEWLGFEKWLEHVFKVSLTSSHSRSRNLDPVELPRSSPRSFNSKTPT